MKISEQHYTNRGITVLVLVSLGFGLMPVLARYLGGGLGLFEQWYLRFAVGLMVALGTFWRKIDLKKFLTLSLREWTVLVSRVFVGQVIGLGLFTLASQKADAGIVSFMQVVPAIPVLGVLLLRERFTLSKGLITLMAFVGAALVVVTNPHSLAHLNVGAMLSLASALFYSAMLVTRKWHDGTLNNQEITVAFMALSGLFAYVISVMFDRRWMIPASHWNMQFALVVIAAGVLSVLINYFISYGFEHVSAIIAGNILSLEEVFGPLAGLIFYRQVLNGRELIGGSVILVSVMAMNFAIRQENRIAEEPIGAIE